MSLLRISLFGGMRIADHGRSEVRLTPVAQELLSYLLLHRQRSHARDVLAGVFWGELPENRARGCLNTTLWRLRRVLEADGVPRGTYIKTTTTGDVSFNCQSDYWLDVEAFEWQVNRLLAGPGDIVDRAEVSSTKTALQLYAGDLLEGVFGDWAVRERERLHRMYVEAMVRLMRHHHRRQELPESLAYGRLVLEHDGLREEVHREMMGIYRDSGQRALAVRQYQICCGILAAELGLAPTEETQRLYAEITGGTGRASLRPEPGPPSPATEVQLLRRVAEACDEAKRQILEAAQLLQRAGELRTARQGGRRHPDGAGGRPGRRS